MPLANSKPTIEIRNQKHSGAGFFVAQLLQPVTGPFDLVPVVALVDLDPYAKRVM